MPEHSRPLAHGCRCRVSDDNDQRLCFGESVHRLVHAYQRAMRDAFRETDIDLTVGQIRVLKGVLLNERPTVQRIAHRLLSDKGQVTRLLGQLADKGLIRRDPNPDDGRAPLLVPTPAGQALLAPILAVQRRAGLRMSAELSDAEAARFIAMADAVADVITDDLDAGRG